MRTMLAFASAKVGYGWRTLWNMRIIGALMAWPSPIFMGPSFVNSFWKFGTNNACFYAKRKEGKRYICNVFSCWLSPCSAIAIRYALVYYSYLSFTGPLLAAVNPTILNVVFMVVLHGVVTRLVLNRSLEFMPTVHNIPSFWCTLPSKFSNTYQYKDVIMASLCQWT